MRDLDDAFNNMGHVKGSDALPGFWAARAAAYRKGGRCGSTAMFHMATASGKYLIWPDTAPAPLGSLEMHCFACVVPLGAADSDDT